MLCRGAGFARRFGGYSMRILVWLLGVWLMLAGTALSARAPERAPAPDWVERVAVPAPNPALRDRPLQMLLVSMQSRFTADRVESYAEMVIDVQSSQGLQQAGTLIIPWQPDLADLIVHEVQILRGGQVIDLLADGQDFTVLRRENNLESAVLDGQMTAVMQANGLAVGDRMRLAYTLRSRPGELGARPETAIALAHGMQTRRLLVRQLWARDLPVRWRGWDRLERPTVRTGPTGTELRLDIADAAGPRPPSNAPVRYQMPALLQASLYGGWDEVGALLAPRYAEAARTAPDSPLSREIARIAASSEDPRVRTLAALRLVQEEIRYFALLMGDGGYLPATADQTWSRRFGDCKGKTTTLLALLHGLGIEAEAVLVHSNGGDALDTRLPQLGLFNHVIVRATIDGRSYWLDGTRRGDRDLEDLAAAPFGWALPLRTAGAALERIPFAAPRRPLMETVITHDLRAGIQNKVPMQIDLIYRGDTATALRQQLAQVGKEAFLRELRNGDQLEIAAPDIASLDVIEDADAGEVRILVTGKAQMDWQRAPGSAARRYRFSDDTIAWDASFARPEGEDADAPFALAHPLSLELREIILLPNGGAGYRIDGSDLDKVVAGTRITRSLSIADGRAEARSTFVRLQPEIAAADARRDLPEIAQINEDRAWLRAPLQNVAAPEARSASDQAGQAPPDPADSAPPAAPVDAAAEAAAEKALADGIAFMHDRRPRLGIAKLEEAVRLAPGWDRAHLELGGALAHQQRLDEAEQALGRARNLDPGERRRYALFAALIAQLRGRPDAAEAALTRGLEEGGDPADPELLQMRARIRAALGRLDEAQADVDKAVTARGSDGPAVGLRARLAAARGDFAAALAFYDAAADEDPDNPTVDVERARILRSAGRVAEAEAAALRAIDLFGRFFGAEGADTADLPFHVLMPHHVVLAGANRLDGARAAFDAVLRRQSDRVAALTARCQVNLLSGRTAEARRDCDRALDYDPGNGNATWSRAVLRLRSGEFAGAKADFSEILSWGEPDPLAFYGRGLAQLRAGQTEAGEADLAIARALQFDVEAVAPAYGLPPRAP
jgi:tetratricopeptide (TPR) repeat protein